MAELTPWRYEQALELAFALGQVMDPVQWAALHDIAVHENSYITTKNPRFRYQATVLAVSHGLELDHSHDPWIVRIGDLAINPRTFFIRAKTRKRRPLCPGGHDSMVDVRNFRKSLKKPRMIPIAEEPPPSA